MLPAFIPLQERAQEASVDASTSYALEFDRVRPGEMWECTNVCLRDNTSSPTRIDVYIGGGGAEHFVGQRQPALAGYVYTLDRPFWVGEGRILTVRFVGGGATDAVEAWVTGCKWLDRGPGSNPGAWEPGVRAAMRAP